MSTPIESKEGRAVWSSDEEGHKRMIYPEEKQQGHKITVSEHAYVILLNMAEDSHDKQVTEEAKNDDFSTLLTALLVSSRNDNVSELLK